MQTFYLHGGYYVDQGQYPDYLKQLREMFVEIKATQVLHLPFARYGIYKRIRHRVYSNWLEEEFGDLGIEFLNAQFIEDIEQAGDPVVLMTGGNSNENLYNVIVSYPPLLDIVKNASFLIGDSAGSMVMGQYFRADNGIDCLPGLGLIENMLLEPHYSQRGGEEKMKRAFDTTDVQWGIGVDELTWCVIQGDTFDGKSYEEKGVGSVIVKKNGS